MLFLLHTYKVCQSNNWIDVIVQQLAALGSWCILDCGLRESAVLYRLLGFRFCCSAVFRFSQKWFLILVTEHYIFNDTGEAFR
jgi:hypothetical protein